MTPVSKALWFVESHFAGELSLADVAEAASVSRFHLTRAFGLATGHSIMRYARGRRLREAARSLAAGAPDILSVALEAGYNSHEAFTRAFRDQFSVTPATVRLRGHLETLELVEAIPMPETSNSALAEPRRETIGALLIAGSRARYQMGNLAGIPLQWQLVSPNLDALSGREGAAGYGVCCDFGEDGHFDYVCGAGVSRRTGLPPGLGYVTIPAATYLVFWHEDHVASIGGTWNAIMSRFLPASGYKIAEGPEFERYDDRFDGATGLGGAEIWIPIET